MVTLGIVGVLMGVGVLSLDRGYLDLETAGQTLVNDLRVARMQATLKGARYKVTWQSAAYKVERMQDNDGDGVWAVDPTIAAKNVSLPSGFLMLSAGYNGYGTNAVFDGRGMLIKENGSPGLAIITVLVVAPDGEHRLVRIWPSGQVEFVANAV